MFVTPTWTEVAAWGNTSRHRGRHLHEGLRAEQDLLALLRKCETCRDYCVDGSRVCVLEKTSNQIEEAVYQSHYNAKESRNEQADIIDHGLTLFWLCARMLGLVRRCSW